MHGGVKFTMFLVFIALLAGQLDFTMFIIAELMIWGLGTIVTSGSGGPASGYIGYRESKK